MTTKAIYRPMTSLECNRAVHLVKCCLPPASMTKRFARTLHHQATLGGATITDKQAAYLAVCCYRFRRQLIEAQHPDLVPHEPPPGYETPTMINNRNKAVEEKQRIAQMQASLDQIRTTLEQSEYQEFVESMVRHCHCHGGYRPCDGVLAGGMCDAIEDEGEDEEEINEDGE